MSSDSTKQCIYDWSRSLRQAQHDLLMLAVGGHNPSDAWLEELAEHVEGLGKAIRRYIIQREQGHEKG